MEEQLRLAGRLAAVGELASGIAHELNNPITAVQGYAQLLAAKKDIDESVKKDLNTIYREAQRAGKITKNLLSFARSHEPEKSFISINEALEKTLELSSHQMKLHNIELEVELDRNLPGTMADFHQMQQIFVNIINNAEQAMLDAHGKGKLVVRTRRHGDMIQIVFTDNGPGIAEENLKRIFDPFFTTKGVGKGTGLGLSICYGLVEAHNGRIYARSKPGEGAAFVVEIPVVPEERPAAETVGIQSKKESARWRK
jgi:signal transduction histidine kinase